MLAMLLAVKLSCHAADSAAGVEFFEAHIRPVLVDKCYSCHSDQAKKLKGALKLDSKAAMLKGGETGPSIIPGEPDKSLLIKAIRYAEENTAMPPKVENKLSSQQISDFETWVKMGAPDPRTGPVAAMQPTKAELAASHWAFKPIKNPAPPKVSNSKWVVNPIDSFVLAKLEEKGMKPTPKADRRSLLRRVSLDLTGLPPSDAEVLAFVNDRAPDSYEKAVDRLLASSAYGERWARHWLDIARYADTKGYVFEEERRYAYAYTYRDYVISSFNNDLPINRFITEQLAADLLPLGEDKRPLAALGYLTLGRRFLNSQPDIIDDRIDVTTRGLMGLTAACARCHDHKYDPIPTKDYYSLYGVFASTHEPEEKPLLGGPLPEKYEQFKKALAEAQAEKDDFSAKKEIEARNTLNSKAGDYLWTAWLARDQKEWPEIERIAKEHSLDAGLVKRWVEGVKTWNAKDHPIFAIWNALATVSEAEWKEKSGGALEAARKIAGLNSLVLAAFTDTPESLKQTSERYGRFLNEAHEAWLATIKDGKPAADKLPDADKEALRQICYAPDAPNSIPNSDLHRLFPTPDSQKIRALQRKIESVKAVHEGAPPRAMALEDNGNPDHPHVFVRGNSGNIGPEVPRQMLEIIEGSKRQPFTTNGSGRLEMAESIVSPENPLTARVFVNRIWMEHIGSPLVRTPSDFGVRSDPPTHPELLDFLASRLMQDGWSLKKLHKLILMSNTYQQASTENPKYAAKDPSNTYLWRMNRRRLDFEAMRDTLLLVSGKLDSKSGGQPVDLFTKPYIPRRSVYGFIDRQNLPGILRTFDFASPDTSSSGRFQTVVPQQALFMINSPFFIEQAESFLSRPEVTAEKDPSQKIQQLYRLAFQREPDSQELRLGLKFYAAQSGKPVVGAAMPAWQYGEGSVEVTNKRLTSFIKLPHFTGEAWQGGDKLPDAKFGFTSLTPTGGHPGNDAAHSVVRRWVAPRDMVANVRSELKHDSENGDGVQGWLLKNGSELLGQVSAKKGSARLDLPNIAVTKGTTLDFVTLCGVDNNSDSFSWSPVVTGTSDSNDPTGASTWSAKDDFAGPTEMPPQLDAWQRYAQALLMSNELVFVD